MFDHSTLAIIWLIILTTAWIVYLCMESFILGSGMLFERMGNYDAIEKKISAASGLHWDGIEVWLITAFAGTFAAFPLVYATLTESMYIAIFLLAMVLVVRGVSIEFLYKDESKGWQSFMKGCWRYSSFLLPIILGIYFGNIFFGLKIGADGFEGSIFSLFNLKALIMGVLFFTISRTTGAAWIVLNTEADKHHQIAFEIAFRNAIVNILATCFVMMAFNTGIGTFNQSALFTASPVLWVLPILAIVVAFLTLLFSKRGKAGWLLITGMLLMALIIITGYVANFPYMVPSSISPEFGIDLYTAASSQYTLNLMFYVALVFVPLVILYQGWKFWYFSKNRKGKAA